MNDLGSNTYIRWMSSASAIFPFVHKIFIVSWIYSLDISMSDLLRFDILQVNFIRETDL